MGDLKGFCDFLMAQYEGLTEECERLDKKLNKEFVEKDYDRWRAYSDQRMTITDALRWVENYEKISGKE